MKIKFLKMNFSFLDKKLNNLRYPLYSYFLLTNGIVFLGWNGFLISKDFMQKNLMLSSQNLKSLRIYTLLTHSFVNLKINDFLFSQLGLFFIGSAFERVFGAKKFFHLYFLGAIFGGLLSLNRPYQQHQ